MSPSGRAALVCLFGAAAIVAFFGRLAPVDEAIWRGIGSIRTCATADAIPWLDWAVRGVFAIVLAGLVASDRRRRFGVVLAMVAVVLAGAFAGELLKTAFERMRPNESPGDLSGNSFPSGHVMNTTMTAAAIAVLAHRLGQSRRIVLVIAALGALCVFGQASYRMLNGSHWASDVLASALLGLAWIFGAETIARRIGAAGIAAVAIASGMLFAGFYAWPDLRVPLASALDRRDEPIARLELGQPSAGLAGRWSHGWREPVGGVSWAMSPRVTLKVPIGNASPSRIRLTMRPPGSYEQVEGCVRVRVWVNGQPRELTLLEGWREYSFPPPSRTDAIEIGIEVLDDRRGEPGAQAPGQLAVHDVRVD